MFENIVNFCHLISATKILISRDN